MARPIWTGVVSFGLVSVPVKAYTATRDREVHFHQIDKGSGARIKYDKVSAATGESVPDDQIVLGYELSPGRHVTFVREEVAALRPESTKAVQVLDFVQLDGVARGIVHERLQAATDARGVGHGPPPGSQLLDGRREIVDLDRHVLAERRRRLPPDEVDLLSAHVEPRTSTT